MTSGFLMNELNKFLNIFFDLGWLGLILFSIFGVISWEIGCKFSGDESLFFKHFIKDPIKKPKDIFGAILGLFLFGIWGGLQSVAILGFAAIALDSVLG